VNYFSRLMIVSIRSCIKLRYTLMLTIPIFAMIVSTIHASSLFFNAQSDTVKKWVAVHEEKEKEEILVRYELLIDDTMNETYTNLIGVLWNMTAYSHEETQY